MITIKSINTYIYLLEKGKWKHCATGYLLYLKVGNCSAIIADVAVEYVILRWCRETLKTYGHCEGCVIESTSVDQCQSPIDRRKSTIGVH